MFSNDTAVAWIRATAAAMEDNAAMLTRLDQAIGDGDHGINMRRGFRAVLERLPDGGADLSTIFRAVSLALIGKVGGASGPLYGSFYLAMGKQLGTASEVTGTELAKALRAGYDAIATRGRARPGDKTILDALGPALDALDAALDAGEPIGAALGRATEAAEEGARATVPMVARKGRASYLGERSAGHQDPGATSASLIVKALAEAVGGP